MRDTDAAEVSLLEVKQRRAQTRKWGIEKWGKTRTALAPPPQGVALGEHVLNSCEDLVDLGPCKHRGSEVRGDFPARGLAGVTGRIQVWLLKHIAKEDTRLVTVEETDLWVTARGGDGGANSRAPDGPPGWRTVAVEGSKDDVKKAVHDLIGPLIALWPSAVIGGYPTFLAHFLGAHPQPCEAIWDAALAGTAGDGREGASRGAVSPPPRGRQ